MRRYETFVIIDPDISEDERGPVIERVQELITQMDGFLVFTDSWGERKLAYEIRKKERGYYVRFDYCGLAPLVNEIERFFRIDDRALKYMTVLLDKEADLEKIKEEKAAAESKSDLDASPVESPKDSAAVAEPEAVKAETKSEVESETEPKVDIEAETEPEADAEPEPEGAAEPVPEVDAEPKPETDAPSPVTEKPVEKTTPLIDKEEA